MVIYILVVMKNTELFIYFVSSIFIIAVLARLIVINTTPIIFPHHHHPIVTVLLLKLYWVGRLADRLVGYLSLINIFVLIIMMRVAMTAINRLITR